MRSKVKFGTTRTPRAGGPATLSDLGISVLVIDVNKSVQTEASVKDSRMQ